MPAPMPTSSPAPRDLAGIDDLPQAHDHRVRSDRPFLIGLAIIGGVYVLLIVAMLAADLSYTTLGHFQAALQRDDIRYAIGLSMFSCTVTAVPSLLVAVPIGYLMSRYDFRGKNLIDAILDIPIVLPPLVVGISLLILFRFPPFRLIDRYVTYEVPAVIIAQFMVASVFAVRTMRVTFDQVSRRREQVALTLGCNRSQAFWLVALPEARTGMLAALTLAWARALGEFGPILVFAGSTPMRTEVLPTAVFLELSIGKLEVAVAVSLIMVLAAAVVLVLARVMGLRNSVMRM